MLPVLSANLTCPISTSSLRPRYDTRSMTTYSLNVTMGVDRSVNRGPADVQ